jgi:hypothetical protein
MPVSSGMYGKITPVGYEEVSATTGTAIGLTAATVNALAAVYPNLFVVIVNTAYPIAYLWYGTPTSGTVQQMAVGGVLQFRGTDMLLAFKGIGIGGTAKYAVNYFDGF